MDPVALKHILLISLKDIYSGEKQLMNSLPRLIKSSSNKDLKMILREDLEITKVQLSRIEEVFAIFSESPVGENCNIIEVLLEEEEEMVEENESQDLIDLNIIGIYQKIKHYHIASYNTVVSFSRSLQEDRLYEKLQICLDEEYGVESKLDKLTEDIVQIYSKVV